MSEATYESIISFESEDMNSEMVEKIVDIYESADCVRDCVFMTDTQQYLQSSGRDPVKIRSSRAATVCLVLLCVLLLTVIVLCVLNTHDRNQFLNQITVLQTRVTELTKQSKFTQERDKLWKKYLEMDGWIYKQSSFYFISPEKKSWSESRRYCRERGADLVIINNKEQQSFVQKMFAGHMWIGLTGSDVSSTWKWVDNSTLSYRIWRSGEPNDGETENCVLTDSSGWADFPCHETLKCICEIKIKK